ncbi:uncharacterized protein LOC142526597 isoform X2 [Primulina tabacum]
MLRSRFRLNSTPKARPKEDCSSPYIQLSDILSDRCGTIYSCGFGGDANGKCCNYGIDSGDCNKSGLSHFMVSTLVYDKLLGLSCLNRVLIVKKCYWWYLMTSCKQLDLSHTCTSTTYHHFIFWFYDAIFDLQVACHHVRSVFYLVPMVISVIGNSIAFAMGLATTLALLGVAASFAGKAYDQIGQGLPVAASILAVAMGLNLNISSGAASLTYRV